MLLTMRAIQVIWFAFLASTAIGETREDLVKTIEVTSAQSRSLYAAIYAKSVLICFQLFLKPSYADQRRRGELREQINKAEEACKAGMCKDLREKLGNGVQYDRITRLMILYDDCMEECTANERRSLDVLHELDLKSEYWSLFQSMEKTKALAEAETLWLEIKGELQLLLEEEQQLNRIERILKFSEADQRLHVCTIKRIHKTEETCARVECKALKIKPVNGNTASTKLVAKYDECMNRCKAKEQRSYDKIKELEKKSHYWTNFSELKKGKTAERVLTYWAKIRNEFKVMEKEQLQLEKIERILKPSAADENMRKELYDRIRETENECKRWALEIVVEEIRTKAYDPCANNTIEEQRKSYRLLKEITKKAKYWTKFEQLIKGASLRTALVYWTEIRHKFKQLEKEEERYESALATLRLTKEETELKERLEAKIREQSRNCTMGQCADLREAMLRAEDLTDQDSAADRLVKCLKTCKRAVRDEIERLNDLQVKNERYKAMKKTREQKSIITALWRYEKDELSLSA
ncbi:hypothetical protein M513_13694 [Trichuris suis]|uniref:Uncharacterized protein n=1 Tax=Trichuris suis TaxID=68888 RepID=A0A085LKD2_9BILA|nr:hypothetical protein M513_13694 [Trichuris suis]